MNPTPLIILSDNPNGHTGLGRICRELTNRIDALMGGVFEVGVAGIGGPLVNKCEYPVWRVSMESDHSIPELAEVVEGFCGDETPIILTIMNAAWLHWLVMPELLPKSNLKTWLLEKKLRLWGYFPVDCEGPRNQLVHTEKIIIEKFERVLAYTSFGARVIGSALGREIEHIGHGTDEAIFYPRDRERARNSEFGNRILKLNGAIDSNTLLLGTVATNTKRKNWPLAFETCRELKARGESVGFWAHTNKVLGYWDLLTMASEFDMLQETIFTFGELSDEDMAWGYASLDMLMGIGPEGWGLPLSECLACNTPVVTGSYAGAAQFVPEAFLVYPYAWQYDEFFCCRRPVYRAQDWADRIQWIRDKRDLLEGDLLDREFIWTNTWPKWEQWLREGIQ